MSRPSFFTEGSTPNRNDPKWKILQKILGATIDIGGSGGGISQLIEYTSGTPANPTNLNSPAIAYDPHGVLPNLNWDSTLHTWN